MKKFIAILFNLCLLTLMSFLISSSENCSKTVNISFTTSVHNYKCSSGSPAKLVKTPAYASGNTYYQGKLQVVVQRRTNSSTELFYNKVSTFSNSSEIDCSYTTNCCVSAKRDEAYPYYLWVYYQDEYTFCNTGETGKCYTFVNKNRNDLYPKSANIFCTEEILDVHDYIGLKNCM